MNSISENVEKTHSEISLDNSKGLNTNSVGEIKKTERIFDSTLKCKLALRILNLIYVVIVLVCLACLQFEEAHNVKMIFGFSVVTLILSIFLLIIDIKKPNRPIVTLFYFLILHFNFLKLFFFFKWILIDIVILQPQSNV